MSEAHAGTEDRHGPGVYEICIKGHLDARWVERIEGMSLTHESDGTTILSGLVTDQAALHGLLRKVRDLGLPLISVIQVNHIQAKEPDTHEESDHERSRKETDR